MKMYQYIIGHKGRGDEVISTLINLGGVNKHNCSGDDENAIYYVEKMNNIINYVFYDSFFGKSLRKFGEEIKLPKQDITNFRKCGNCKYFLIDDDFDFSNPKHYSWNGVCEHPSINHIVSCVADCSNHKYKNEAPPRLSKYDAVMVKLREDGPWSSAIYYKDNRCMCDFLDKYTHFISFRCLYIVPYNDFDFNGDDNDNIKKSVI